MGNQVLDAKADESEKYKIITIPASQLPIDHKNLIIGPFLNSLRYGNDLFKLIDQDDYYSHYAKYIDSLLARPTSTIKMAVLDDDTVLGWSLLDHKLVHYIWVKKEVRRQGIGKSLLPKEFDTITHITRVGINIWVSKYQHVRFNPF